MKNVFLVILSAAVVYSAINVVLGQHRARKHFVEIQELRKQEDALNEEWGKLQLEQSTWATDDRVEELARKKLKMVEPDPESIVVVLQ